MEPSTLKKELFTLYHIANEAAQEANIAALKFKKMAEKLKELYNSLSPGSKTLS